jgi:hypothetical protein
VFRNKFIKWSGWLAYYILIHIIAAICDGMMWSLSLGFTSDWQEQFEFWGELVFCVESVGEINSSNSAVGVNLHSKGFNIVGTVGSSSEIGQVELNLVPALIESHGHCANERLYSSSWLVVGSSESTSNVLVIQNLHFEGKVFLQLYTTHLLAHRFIAHARLSHLRSW